MAALAFLGLLVGPVTEVVKCFGKPMMRQFNYLCCFNSNKQHLGDVATDLVEKKDEMQGRVSAARNNVEQILPAVTTWLGRVDEIQREKDEIDNQIAVLQNGCLAVKSRFLLSRRVKKTAEAMEKLLGDCPQDGHISRPPLPLVVAVPDIPETPTAEFESRKQIEDDVMAILKDERVNVVGICGMGGVGKTTMAKKIKDRVKVENLFGESVLAVVSQEPDKFKIQAELAEQLGLNLKEITTLSSRAHKLLARLIKDKKRILVILDDVWEDLDLEELGILCKSGSKGCTILLTSRHKDVIKRMGAEPIWDVKILSEIEARSLFQQNFGTFLDVQTRRVAEEVVKKCGGLPLALVTVARALKGQDNPDWQYALQQLNSWDPEGLGNVLKGVYNPLKLSYDFLIENAKSIFLLCCLFPEDSDIPVEYLRAYAMGLRMFKGISELEQVRKITYSLVDMLKSRFLLLGGWGKHKHHVRMHDVIRDVAIFMASSKEKQLIRCDDHKCAWISPFLGERTELFKGPIFPNLLLLVIQGDEWQISNNCFEGVTKLNVLSMSRIYSLKSSLPHTTKLLKELRTLILDNMFLENISVVAELEKLEIFICRGCPKIKMLPVEIRSLVRLKLLELSNCSQLNRVAPGIISSLVELEELKMVNSFNGWEAEDSVGKERTNAALSELQSLSSLTCLTIQIKDSYLVAQQFNLPPNVGKYDISIPPPRFYRVQGFERNIEVHLDEKEITSLGNWFAECIRRVERMQLCGECSNIVDLQLLHQNMRWLSLGASSRVKKLVNTTSSTLFPQLQYLRLFRLDNLEEIYHIDGPIQEGFHNLKSLRLENLPALKHWLMSSPYQHNACLPQLKKLTIRDCEMMEQVFLWTEEEKENEIRTIIFPNLKILKLSKLPSLTSLSKGVERIGFPLITEVHIHGCPRLKGVVSNYHDGDEDSSHLFCKQVSSDTFFRLERLVIRSCKNMKCLFSSPIAQNLCNLNKMIIDDCEEMIKVFEDDKGKTSHLFPQLQELEMTELPKLKGFCKWAQMEFPLLRELCIFGCPEMERISSGSLIAPNLKILRVGFKDIAISTGQDLNAELQQAKEEESFYKWVLKVKKMKRMSQLWRDFVERNNLLKLQIEDSGVAAEQISFPSHIVRYTIGIGACTSFRWSFDREMRLDLPRDIILGNWIHQCVRSVEYMHLQGEGSNNLDLGQAQNMRELSLEDCSTVKKLINIRPPSTDDVRDHLEVLRLVNLPSLEEICPMPEGSSIIAFDNLKELYLKDLPALKHLWKSNSPIQQLERLYIMDCEMMEQVFLWNDENDTGSEKHRATITFPNLEFLQLSKLPRLKAVCNGIESIKFPLLSTLDIEACPQLKSVVSIHCSTLNSEGIDDSGDECLHIFCKPEKVAFSGLKVLSIGGYENISSLWCNQILIQDLFAGLEELSIYDLDNLRSLFSSSIVKNLNNLCSLNIYSCGEMVKVIEDDNKDTNASSEMTTVCVFPKLQYLYIRSLPKLEMFCGWKSCALELSSLDQVWINSCPEMKIFSLGAVTAPYQVTFKIDDKEVINDTQDLNVMLQQPVFRGEPEE